MLEYLINIYSLPLISTIIGTIIVYLYDRFEKKQYTSAIYLRIAILLYISSFVTFYLSTNIHLFGIIKQTGGSSIDPQSLMPQANVLTSHLEQQFKTGVPTF